MYHTLYSYSFSFLVSFLAATDSKYKKTCTSQYNILQLLHHTYEFCIIRWATTVPPMHLCKRTQQNIEFTRNSSHNGTVRHCKLAKPLRTEWDDRFPHVLITVNPLNPELNPICYLLALLAHHFLCVSRLRVKSLTLRLLMSCNIWSAYSWCF